MITDFTRQSELINIHEFDKRINVIGAGALGSWLTFFLLKMGFKKINLYDFDVVEEHNIPNQIFREDQIGISKVESMKNLYRSFFNEENARRRLAVYNHAITPENAPALKGIVFSCVDSMKARKEIYESCFKYGQADMWIEGRIGLFGAYVYTLDRKDIEVMKKYEETLYDDEIAEVSACGISQTALPSAVNCASIMLMQLISAHRGNEVLNKIEYSIPDLTCMSKRW